MNCYFHTDISSVATCQDCTKGLCKNCTDKFGISICPACNSKRASSEKKEIIIEFIWMIIAGIFGLIFISQRSIAPEFEKYVLIEKIYGAYIFVGLFIGWRTLNKLTSEYFLVLPIIGWFIYFFFKFFASMFIGMFLVPFRLIKNIKRLNEISTLQQKN